MRKTFKISKKSIRRLRKYFNALTKCQDQEIEEIFQNIEEIYQNIEEIFQRIEEISGD